MHGVDTDDFMKWWNIPQDFSGSVAMVWPQTGLDVGQCDLIWWAELTFWHVRCNLIGCDLTCPKSQMTSMVLLLHFPSALSSQRQLHIKESNLEEMSTKKCVWQTSSLHPGKEMCQMLFNLSFLTSIKHIHNNVVTVWYNRKIHHFCHKFRWVNFLHIWAISSMHLFNI